MTHVAEEVGIFLLFFLLGEVPDVYVSAIAAGSQDARSKRTPLNFNHTILLARQSRKSSGQISQIPHRHVLICRSRSKQKLIKRWEIQRVDLISMRNNLKDRFLIIAVTRASKPRVPYADQSVIRAAGEDAWMEFMPCYVFDGCVVMQYLEDRLYSPVLLFVFLNIPNTNPFVWGAW